MAEELEAKVKKLEAKVKAVRAENAELEEQRKKDIALISALQAKLDRAEAKAASLEKLLARDGPHDPVSKYD